MKSADMRISSFISRISQYLFSIGLIASITAIFSILRDELDTTIIALLYLIPLGLITAYWGLGAGITSAIITFLSFNYFFIQPYYTLVVHRPTDVVILIIFLFVAVVISQLVGQMKKSLALATDREREAKQLYELSTELAGLNDEQTIAQVLVKRIQILSHAEYVEVNLIEKKSFSIPLPEIQPPTRPCELSIPIQTARNILGEIKFWKTESTIKSEEKRLLETFASQGALALERARLSNAESRAKILEESDNLKSILLSSVSHELRTPLSTIKAAASSLRGHEVNWDSPASVELISAIDDEADHLNMLVGNLLDMSRIESGALKPKREWNILSEIVGSVLERMKHSTDEHQIEIDIPESLPFVPVDYVQMEQVFTNLISNSLKYAPPNTLIKILAKQEENQIHVQVSNQGPQIPAEHLERIFDKFYRITAADRVTGTGLGLSICKGIVQAHDGKIWTENIVDGLAFHFTLPLTWDGAPPLKLPTDSETE